MRQPQLWIVIPLAVLVILASYSTAYWVCLEPRSRRWALAGAPAAVLFLGGQLLLLWALWP